MNGLLFSLPKLPWKGIAAIAVAALAFVAGKDGWVLIGPDDQFASLRTSDAQQSIDIQLIRGELSDMREEVRFANELLCDQVLSDSARSSGDRFLRQRCRVITESALTRTSNEAGG